MLRGLTVFFHCLLSAGLLTVCFPQREWSVLAWIALAPLLKVLDGQKPWRAFRRGWLFGFFFFFATLGWIVYVTPIGTVLLMAYLALYTGLFGVLLTYFQFLPLIPRMFVLSACWTVLEFIRAHFLSGFGWAMLGHTQYKNIWLIQIADITGAYGVSFLVILVNLLVFETWKAGVFLAKPTAIVAAVLAAALIYGFWVSKPRPHETANVGLVQPNIALVDSWDDGKKPQIIDKTIRLTNELRGKGLDLIIWPETSLPGEIDDSLYLTGLVRATAAQMHTPLLIGSVFHGRGDHYYNSAFLIGPDGQMLGRYDKIHLVPFGEFLPLRPLLGWINKFVPLDDFTFGTHETVFSIGEAPEKKFSVLICFEDTLSDLSRRFALKGAEFFVNMTNDAWFRATRAPFVHLQTAVFSCVANHRGLARAANTGVSAIVDPWGRITTLFSDSHGHKTFSSGVTWGRVPVVREKTFYTKYGDIFTIACFLCIVVAIGLRRSV